MRSLFLILAGALALAFNTAASAQSCPVGYDCSPESGAYDEPAVIPVSATPPLPTLHNHHIPAPGHHRPYHANHGYRHHDYGTHVRHHAPRHYQTHGHYSHRKRGSARIGVHIGVGVGYGHDYGYREHRRYKRRHHGRTYGGGYRKHRRHHVGKRRYHGGYGEPSFVNRTKFCSDQVEWKRMGWGSKKGVRRCVWVRNDLIHRYRGY